MSDYNSNPIAVNSTMASGWRSLQTLNTGNLPSTLQQTSGAVTRQWGINVIELWWDDPGVGASVLVTDPNDGTVLASMSTPASYAGAGESITPTRRNWRDFKVSITGGTLYIHYRA